MYYMHSGKVYAPRVKNGVNAYDVMRVQLGEDDTPCIVNAGSSVKTLPSGSLPMTEREVYARIPAEKPEKPEKPKRGRKVAEDVSDV